MLDLFMLECVYSPVTKQSSQQSYPPTFIDVHDINKLPWLGVSDYKIDIITESSSVQQNQL